MPFISPNARFATILFVRNRKHGRWSAIFFLAHKPRKIIIYSHIIMICINNRTLIMIIYAKRDKLVSVVTSRVTLLLKYI